jgi:hypothetical protein
MSSSGLALDRRAAAATEVAFADPAGDASTGPDITRVQVSNDLAGTLTFIVNFGNRPSGLQSGEQLWFEFDSDRSRASGPSYPSGLVAGIDYFFLVVPAGAGARCPSPIAKWTPAANGTTGSPAPSLRCAFLGDGSYSATISRTDLAIGSSFDFYVEAAVNPPGLPRDLAPDGEGSRYTYSLSTEPESLAKYAGYIVQWAADQKAQKTSWLVGSDLKRRWIADVATYNCLIAKGVKPWPTPLPASVLDRLTDVRGARATCKSSGAPPAARKPPAGCAANLVLVSRGSGDRLDQYAGLGTVGLSFANRIRNNLGWENVDVWNNRYAAVGLTDNWRQWLNFLGAGTKLSGLGLGAYHDSVVEGKKRLLSKIRSSVEKCGLWTRLFLVGYSQGAQVTADVYQRELTKPERARVRGMALFGDPYFNGASPANVGEFSASRNGVLGRRWAFADSNVLRIRSYCHAHDPVCQSVYMKVLGKSVLDPLVVNLLGRKLVASQHLNYAQHGEPQAAADFFTPR